MCPTTMFCRFLIQLGQAVHPGPWPHEGATCLLMLSPRQGSCFAACVQGVQAAGSTTVDVNTSRCDCLAAALLLHIWLCITRVLTPCSFVCSAFHSWQLLLCHAARVVSNVLIDVLCSRLKLAQQAAAACHACSAPEQLLQVLAPCVTLSVHQAAQLAELAVTAVQVARPLFLHPHRQDSQGEPSCMGWPRRPGSLGQLATVAPARHWQGAALPVCQSPRMTAALASM